MKYFLIAYVLIPLLGFMLFSTARADTVILKSGQIIKDVTVKDEGDTLVCESQSRSYYISKKSVKSIVKTDDKIPAIDLRGWADKFIQSLPPKIKMHIYNYPRLIIACIACILSLVLTIGILNFFWNRIKLLYSIRKKRRLLIRYVKRLDEHEKAILREFIIQGQNTIEMPVEDKTVAGMIHKGVLESIGTKGEYSIRGLMLPVIISPMAKKRLSPQRIGMPAVLDDENKKKLIQSRPKFISEMASFYKKLERKNMDYW